METVVKQKEKNVVVTNQYPSSLEDEEKISFTIRGLIPEGSIEDRDVFISIKTNKSEKENSILDGCWLRGEKAIELGQALIQEGLFALNANRIQFQLLNRIQRLKQFINENRINLIKIKEIDSNPTNYGGGFHTFNIKPIWKIGQEPKYEEDFNFDNVLYFRNEQDFKKKNKYLFQNIPLEIT